MYMGDPAAFLAFSSGDFMGQRRLLKILLFSMLLCWLKKTGKWVILT